MIALKSSSTITAESIISNVSTPRPPSSTSALDKLSLEILIWSFPAPKDTVSFEEPNLTISLPAPVNVVKADVSIPDKSTSMLLPVVNKVASIVEIPELLKVFAAVTF